VITSAILQTISGGAAIARVATSNYYLSRSLGAASFFTIALDYAARYTEQPDAAVLVGATIFAVLTLRNVLILIDPRLDQDHRARLIACLVSFVLCSGLSAATDVIKSAPLALTTILPFIALALGALGESSNDMSVRRRYILAIGCVLAIFAIETEAWGLLAKSLISDIGAALFYIVRRPVADAYGRRDSRAAR
jgi:hypothetical protein